jgi:hypothetical protein
MQLEHRQISRVTLVTIAGLFQFVLLCDSVIPRCLCGESWLRLIHHRDTEKEQTRAPPEWVSTLPFFYAPAIISRTLMKEEQADEPERFLTR